MLLPFIEKCLSTESIEECEEELWYGECHILVEKIEDHF
jgi:hypothetical protein